MVAGHGRFRNTPNDSCTLGLLTVSQVMAVFCRFMVGTENILQNNKVLVAVRTKANRSLLSGITAPLRELVHG